MPRPSATDRAATCISPVATSTSHPSAASDSLSNCSATSSSLRRPSSSADSGVAPCMSGRTGPPTGISTTPAPASRCAYSVSGGAHTVTRAPRLRNSTASATTGSTSPRDPYVVNNACMSATFLFLTPCSGR